jgi:hypothetical protein
MNRGDDDRSVTTRQRRLISGSIELFAVELAARSEERPRLVRILVESGQR